MIVGDATCSSSQTLSWLGVLHFRFETAGIHPQTHLQSFQGILQADGYAGFHHLYGEQIREAACWAHVRRKFYDLHQATKSPIAFEAMQRIAALYAIEAEIRG